MKLREEIEPKIIQIEKYVCKYRGYYVGMIVKRTINV